MEAAYSKAVCIQQRRAALRHGGCREEEAGVVPGKGEAIWGGSGAVDCRPGTQARVQYPCRTPAGMMALLQKVKKKNLVPRDIHGKEGQRDGTLSRAEHLRAVAPSPIMKEGG